MREDTIKLLRECDAGIKMGISAIEDVYGKITHEDFRRHIEDQKNSHTRMQREIRDQLDTYGDEGKDPNPMTKGMAHVKTGMKLGFDCTDETIASLLTDGCHMGVKSLSRYLNQYPDADEGARNVARRLISLEDTMEKELRPYL